MTSPVADPLARFRLDGRVAVVTGGGHGIGRACCEALAHAGAHVAVADRDGEAAEACALSIRDAGGVARAFAVDVADESSVDSAMAEVAGAQGRLDILVANAGTAIRRPTLELPLQDWDTVVSVNMTGVFLSARAAARHMIAAGHGGSIVTMASIMGLSGGGLYPNISYQATKGAVVNMTRALAVEWARDGIRVNGVAPTWVRTGFIKGLLAQPDLVARIESVTPLGRLAEPEEVASAVLFLASPAASMVTGHVLAVDGGFLAQ